MASLACVASGSRASFRANALALVRETELIGG